MSAIGLALPYLLHGHCYCLSQAFDLSKVVLTNPPASIGVLKALDVIQQIITSYNERCFVYNHDVVGVNRRLNNLEGVTSGATRSDKVPFRFNVTGKLTNKSRCSIFVMPLPESKEELLDFDRPLWYVSSPIKVLIYVQESGNPDRGLNLTKIIPAINTTFTHLLIRKISVLNRKDNTTEDQAEIFCLGVDPAFKVADFSQCLKSTKNLNGVTMTVSMITAVPVAYPGPNGEMIGSDVEILNALKNKFGFIYRLRREAYVDSPDNITVGQIIRVGSGASDLGVGGTLQTNERLKQVTYLPYMYIQNIAFITPTLQPVDLFYTPVLPFDGLTWGLIGASSVCLALFLQLTDFTWKKFFYADSVSKTDTMYHHSVIVFSSLIGYELPHSWLWHRMVHAKSILLAVTFFSGFFLNMDYKSTLRTNLYIEEYSKPINTPEEIYQSGLPVYIQRPSIQLSILKTSPNPYIQMIVSRIEEGNTLYSYSPNLTWLANKVEDGEAIYVGFTMAPLNASSRISTDILFKAISSFTAPKCSILPSLFNINLLWLNAAGIPLRLYKYFLGDKALHNIELTNSRFAMKSTEDPLNVKQILLIFIILAGGLVISTVALAYEILIDRKENKNEQNTVTEIEHWKLVKHPKS